jgi:hypothetical protein
MLPEVPPGVKRWLEKDIPAPMHDSTEQPMTALASAPEPTVSVPVSSTNLVVSQIFTEVMTAAQVAGGIVLGSVLNDPGALTSLTHGWPGWLAAMAIAGLQWVKKTYFDASNAATVSTVSALQKVKP